VALLVALSAGCVSAYGAVHTAAGNKNAAEGAAASLLASLNLPTSAIRQAGEPAGDDGALGQPASRPATPNLVDDEAWWIVPETTQQVLAYVDDHPPAGGTPDLSGQSSTTGQPTVTSTGFGWPAVGGELGLRSLVVAIVQLQDGSTGVRADGEAVWITPRPRSERIPAGARRVVVSTTEGEKTVEGPTTITAHPEVAKAVSVLNALPAWQPGLYSCPADFGWRIRLAFYRSAATSSAGPRAVAIVDPNGCGVVQLALAGRRQPALSDGYTAAKRLSAALHFKLDTGPPPRPASSVRHARSSARLAALRPTLVRPPARPNPLDRTFYSASYGVRRN
jgi:hypothetical protein